MKLYQGTKKVYANPIKLGAFKDKFNKNPYQGMNDVHSDDEDGYEVQYSDGYTSYSPKDIFDEHYHCIESFVDRLKLELKELTVKLEAGTKWLEENGSDIDPVASNLLHIQLSAMTCYKDALERRIKLHDDGN